MGFWGGPAIGEKKALLTSVSGAYVSGERASENSDIVFENN